MAQLRCGICVSLAVVFAAGGLASADVVTQWTFNSNPSDGNAATGTFAPAVGVGTAALFGGLTQTPFDGGSPYDPNTTDNSSWRVAGNAPQGAESGARGVEFATSTVGYSSVTVQWDQRYSSTSSKYMRLSYSIDGSTFVSYPTLFSTPAGATGDIWMQAQTADLSVIPGVANNPNFRFRIAAVFAPSTSAYEPSSSTGTYGTGGNTQRYDMVTVSGLITGTTGPSLSSSVAAPAAICSSGGSLNLSVRVTPGQLPVSTGLSVTANLAAVGGASALPLRDDGLAGDAVAGDGVYSADVAIAGPATVGSHSIVLSVSDLQGRNSSTNVSVIVADCTTNSTSRVVISQVYGGGSNLGPPVSPLNADYVELYNRSAQTVDMTGWSVQYAGPVAAGGFESALDQVLLSGTIRPGQYMLVRFKDAGNTGASIPAPDFSVRPGTGGMGNNGGRVALVRSQALIGTNCADPRVEDVVGYGDAAACFEGGAATATTANDTAAVRKLGGVQDTNQNFNDFAVSAPSPHNRTFGGFLGGFGSASPDLACNGTTIRFAVQVVGATGPASSSVQVRANLSSVAGSSTAALFDDGTHGDSAAGDLTYTLDYILPGSVTTGFKTIALSVADAQGRTDSSELTLGVSACVPSSAPVVISQIFGGGGNLGSPFNADFVEIFNRSGAPVSLAGWSLQYADGPSTATFGGVKQVNLSGSIGVGEYRLIRCSAPGSGGAGLPTPDFVAANPFGVDNQFGRFALVNSTTPILTNCSSATVVDFVGYGVATVCYEGLLPTANLDNPFVALRKDGGCRDTDQNALDFDVIEPLDLPRNAASPASACTLPTTGACCVGTTCTVTSISACIGAFQGIGTLCGTVGNPTTCCKANFNGMGGISVQDIFDFLAAWFAGSPSANVNGTGGVTVQDIFDFLSLWFSGC